MLLLYASIWISHNLHNVKDQRHSRPYFVFGFAFGMYTLVCLYLLCIALPVAVAVQFFWNKDEFCEKFNFRHVEESSIDTNYVSYYLNIILLYVLLDFLFQIYSRLFLWITIIYSNISCTGILILMKLWIHKYW